MFLHCKGRSDLFQLAVKLANVGSRHSMAILTKKRAIPQMGKRAAPKLRDLEREKLEEVFL